VGLLFPANLLGEEKPCENVCEKRKGTAKTVCPWRKGGRTISRESRYTKKFMGWCPYAKLTGVDPRISSVNFEADDRSGGEKGDRSRREKTPIKRNSKQFLFQFFVSICAIIAGTASIIMKSLMNFYLVLMGFGLLLDAISRSETDAKLSRLMSICSYAFWSAMCFRVYFHFKPSGSIVMAKLFVLFGIYGAAKAIYSTIPIFRKRTQGEAF
jgi:hypothetical protein